MLGKSGAVLCWDSLNFFSNHFCCKMEEESKKKESKKIQLIFRNKMITRQFYVSLGFEQKLKKAMKFCRDKLQIKPCKVTRFFHQNKELFENDTPQSSGLVNHDTIEIIINDFNSKYKQVSGWNWYVWVCVCVDFRSLHKCAELPCFVVFHFVVRSYLTSF